LLKTCKGLTEKVNC
jgi:hypothetical protein